MPVRSIASLSLSFGLVSIPVKLYSATESSAAIRFKLMAPGGSRVRQQYVSEEPLPPSEVAAPPPPEPPPRRTSVGEVAERAIGFPASRQEVVAERVQDIAPAPTILERSDMVKGYEFEKGKFVLFTADELKVFEEGSRQTIDIVAFIPEHSVDPIYYDKPYFLAPEKRGAKAYSLLVRAMRDTGRCALAKWAWRSKEYVVEIRPTEGGLVLQQLLYSDEVRSIADLDVDLPEVGEGELKLAKQLIDQISADSYDPTRFVDEEKKRNLEAVEKKIAGKKIVAPAQHEPATDSNVVDLMQALRASLMPTAKVVAPLNNSKSNVSSIGERKTVRRASSGQESAKPTGRKSSKK